VYRRPVGIIVDIKALRLEGLVSVESIDVTDVKAARAGTVANPVNLNCDSRFLKPIGKSAAPTLP